MADTEARDRCVRRQGKGIDRRLPASAKVDFRRICILCRKYPRVHGNKKGMMSIRISDGVLILQSDCVHGDRPLEGRYKIIDRMVLGRRIVVRPHKARGSHNHHKFVVVISNGTVS